MTRIIAEVGLAHDGSLNAAHSYIDAVAATGADAIKFQWHHPAEGTADEAWRRAWSRYGETRAQYWRRTGFTEAEWRGLRGHAGERGLLFGASVFCPEAALAYADTRPDFWKISAGMVTHTPLLDIVKALHGAQPVYVSAGLGTVDMLDLCLMRLGPGGTLLHCVSVYPTPHEAAAWQRRHQLRVLAQDLGWQLGLSDHSGTIWPGVLACAEKDAVVEVHVCWDRAQGGPDASSSLTMGELAQLVTARDAMQALRASGPWARPDYAPAFEPKWLQEDGRLVMKKVGPSYQEVA